MLHFHLAVRFLLFLGGTILAVSLPLQWGKIRTNPWYGIRFSQSFRSERHWYLINRYGGRLLVRWALVTLGLGGLLMVVPSMSPGVCLGVVLIYPLTIALPIALTYRYAQSLPPSSSNEEFPPNPKPDGKNP